MRPVGRMSTAADRLLSAGAALAVPLALGIGLFLIFGPTFVSGFELYPGDLWDWRFNGVIAEHWYAVLRGQAEWRSPIFFFPAKDVLGYSDALILFAPFYIPFRLIGVDPASAFVLCAMSIIAFGFLTAYWMFTKVLLLPRVIALGLAFCFSFSSLLVSHMPHAQLFACAFLPLVVMLSRRFAVSILAGQPSPSHGLWLSVMLSALLYTSFYIGYFTLLTLASFSLIYLTLDTCRGGGAALALWRTRRALLVPIAVFAIGLIPFALTYTPAYKAFGARDWPSIACMLPQPADLFNTGFNFAWGWVFGRSKAETPCYYELRFGFPLLTLSLWLASTLWLLAITLQGRGNRNTNTVLALALTVPFWWAVMLRTPWGSLWYIIYSFLPGGSAVRAVYRFQVVLHLCALIPIGLALSRLFASKKRTVSIAAVFAICALCLEQYNTAFYFFSGRQHAAKLASIGPPPPSCAQFFVDENSVRHERFETINLDAMIVAQRHNVPTLNGYSAYLPPEFHHNIFTDPRYREKLRAWTVRHGITRGLCMLDLKSKTWTEIESLRGGDLSTDVSSEKLALVPPVKSARGE